MYFAQLIIVKLQIVSTSKRADEKVPNNRLKMGGRRK